MSETFTKGMARNIYFGGSVFFILLFLNGLLGEIAIQHRLFNNAIFPLR